jgi:hypothetical protein
MESKSSALILNPHPTSYDALMAVLWEEEGDYFCKYLCLTVIIIQDTDASQLRGDILADEISACG